VTLQFKTFYFVLTNRFSAFATAK